MFIGNMPTIYSVQRFITQSIADYLRVLDLDNGI